MDLSFSYDPGKPLIKNFGISIGSHDRVLVVGKNGKGKTTLLKLMAGVLKAQIGETSSPLAVAPGYYEQTHVENLSDSNTVMEEIAAANPEMDQKRLRMICAAMLFEGDDALKRISVLSGGEKSRVTLGKLIATPLNLLLLDEPTNHLDLESSDALLAAIDNFDGAVVMVTHNEMFLHALAERLIVFQNDEIRVYEGDYQRFLEKVGWQEEKERGGEFLPREGGGAPNERFGRKEYRRLRSEILVERSKILKPLENKMVDLERSIEGAENDLAIMNREIIEASQARESSKIVELSKSIPRKKEEIDAFFLELEKVTREYEVRKPEFEKRLRAIEDEGQSGNSYEP
jgi:ATP-binding cassette subfamily F protein 3